MKSNLAPLQLSYGWAIRLPLEARVAIAFTVIWLAGLLAGLPISVPSQGHVLVLEVQYALPIFVSALLQLVFTFLMHRRWQRAAADAFCIVRYTPLFALAIFLYYNFKAWMPLVNPRLYDAELYAIDQANAPVLRLFFALRHQIADALPYHVDLWYSVIFLGMFFLSLAVHAVLDTPFHQRRLMLGLCLILLFGGLSYSLMPAEGPFLFRSGPNDLAASSQRGMHAAFEEVRATGELPPGYFTAPLGAMPSLHVAFALFFTLWAVRSVKLLLVPYLPMLFWVVIEAAASGWHYLLDLPAGAVLALIAMRLADRWIVNGQAPVASTPAPLRAGRQSATTAP